LKNISPKLTWSLSLFVLGSTFLALLKYISPSPCELSQPVELQFTVTLCMVRQYLTFIRWSISHVSHVLAHALFTGTTFLY